MAGRMLHPVVAVLLMVGHPVSSTWTDACALGQASGYRVMDDSS